MTIAVILAGGKGVRFGDPVPKQLKLLAGKPILQYVVETFVSHTQIEEVIIVHPADHGDAIKAIASPFSILKPIRFVEGGSTRTQSTLAALEEIGDKNVKVLFHDAVRPFLSHEIVSRSINALDNHDAIDVVAGCTDTIVRVNGEGALLSDIPVRDLLRRGQTPQGFWSETLKKAYMAIGEDLLSRFSDDCGVLLFHDPKARIAAVEGDERNIKITTPMDLFLAEQILYSGYAQISDSPLEDGKSRSVVILGASSGLGLASVESVTAEGWTPFQASTTTGVDVRDPASLQRFLDHVESEFGRVDAIVNYAGILGVSDLENMSQAEVRDIIEVNLLGSINVAQVGLPFLKRSKGQLVLVASSSYFRGRKGTAVYSASKAGVVNLTQALAEEWAEEGVCVSCMVPRRADTPMRRKAFPNEDHRSCMPASSAGTALIALLKRRQNGMIKHVY